MNEAKTMEKIKTIRKRLGLSQEELAEKSGLSLRSVQRIENGETEPRGDSLKRVAAALGVTPNEIVDWTVQEDRHFLSSLNLSALTFLFFPLLGIIVPYILWNNKRETVKGAERTGKAILNFQITWNIVFFIFLIVLFFYLPNVFRFAISSTAVFMKIGFWGKVFLLLIPYNLILILVNQVRISKGREVRYFPRINFLR